MRSWKRAIPGALKMHQSHMHPDNNILNRLGHTEFTFLVTDIETALTLAQIAANARSDLEKKTRNRQNARRAYDSVTRLRDRVALTGDQNAELDDRLTELKSVLESLGEVFSSAA